MGRGCPEDRSAKFCVLQTVKGCANINFFGGTFRNLVQKFLLRLRLLRKWLEWADQWHQVENNVCYLMHFPPLAHLFWRRRADIAAARAARFAWRNFEMNEMHAYVILIVVLIRAEPTPAKMSIFWVCESIPLCHYSAIVAADENFGACVSFETQLERVYVEPCKMFIWMRAGV